MKTSRATAKGGRDGKVTSSDGVLALELAMPGTPKAKERGDATNPEQLFAAGYAACFDSALQLTAGKARMQIETEVTADVSLLKDEADGGYKLGVKLQVKGTNMSLKALFIKHTKSVRIQKRFLNMSTSYLKFWNKKGHLPIEGAFTFCFFSSLKQEANRARVLTARALQRAGSSAPA